MKFLREQEMVKGLEESKNGCILMHYGTWQ